MRIERDRYRILRDAASEASLRLRVSNLKLDADCLAIRAERDKAVRDCTLLRREQDRFASLQNILAEEMAPTQVATSQEGACKPKGFWSWVMRQKPFGRGKG